jgi:hypothetical protein
LAGKKLFDLMKKLRHEKIMKNTITVLFVFLILIGCVRPYQESVLGGGSGDKTFQKLEISSGEKLKEAKRNQELLKQASRLRSFLLLYCRAYESKNLNKFSAFFASDATENNKPFHEYLPRYRRNFQRIESLTYRIVLDSYSLNPDTGNIDLKGKYFIKYLLKGQAWKENNGIISMELIKKGDSYLVKRLNYSFLSLE